MLLLATCLLISGQSEASLLLHATPLPKVLAEMSRLSGRQLVASTALANEVVIIRINKVSWKSVSANLAKSLDALWQEMPNGSRMLVPDVNARKAAIQLKSQRDLATLNESLSSLSKKLSQQPTELNDKAVRDHKLRLEIEKKRLAEAQSRRDYEHAGLNPTLLEQSPAWRMLVCCLLRLPRQTYIAMPHDARRVWSDKATSMQSTFPSDWGDLTSRYGREMELMDPSMMIHKIELILTKWENQMAFSAQLRCLDSSGKTIDDAVVAIRQEYRTTPVDDSFIQSSKSSSEDSFISVTQEVTDVRIALSNDAMDPRRVTLLMAMRPKLLDPVRFEPTSWHRSEDMLAAATRLNRNLIGGTSDFISATYWKDEKKTANQILSSFAPDNWSLVKRDDTNERVSRQEAKTLISECIRSGGISVDRAADWAGKSSDRFPFMSWVGDYIRVLFPGRGPYSALATMIDDEALRLWFNLGSESRASLKLGATIRISDLRHEASAQVERMVYWFGGLDDSTVDPTDRLPDGISDGMLKLSVQETPVLEGWKDEDGPPATRMPIDPIMFGKSLVKGSTYWEIRPEVFRNWNRFRIGVNRKYTLHFDLMPGHIPMTQVLSETLFDNESQILKKLPEAMQSQVDMAKASELAKPKVQNNRSTIPPP